MAKPRETSQQAPSQQPAGVHRSALEECDLLIAGYGHEARKMQILGWLASITVLASSALVPVAIVVSTETGAFIFGKLAPSLLAAVAALAAGCAQIVRPYDRWRLFNTQRYRLEAERMSFVHRLGDYTSTDAERVLAERVASTVRTVTDEWRTSVVPESTARAMEEIRAGSSAQ